MRELYSYFSAEDCYEDLDGQGAVSRLAEAIRCRTVSGGDADEFQHLRALMQKHYPHVCQDGQFEVLGRSVLITIPGSDPGLLPCLYMSHQDVVPADESSWTHGPFSGDVTDGFIWGRGTLDIKEMVFGILEAAEYLLSRGQSFRRTAYLAFGEDEETMNEGAGRIAGELERRGIRLAFLLDEGGCCLSDGGDYGAPGEALGIIELMEKGYADLELRVTAAGGHSSRPFGGTSLAHLSKALSEICDNPFPAQLPSPMRQSFETLAPYITEEPLSSLVKDVDRNAAQIAEWCAAHPETFAYVTTTIAPTMIEGGSSAPNILPGDMRAVVNFRLSEGMTPDALMQHCRDAVKNTDVTMRFLQANAPSRTARTDGLGYRSLTESLARFYPEVRFIPGMTAGATDARQYERICDCCLRCSPFLTTQEDVHRGTHGVDERIPVRSYLQGIRILIDLMERCNVSPLSAK